MQAVVHFTDESTLMADEAPSVGEVLANGGVFLASSFKIVGPTGSTNSLANKIERLLSVSGRSTWVPGHEIMRVEFLA